MVLSADVSGTFSSQQDKDAFAWLVHEKGAYRVTVVPNGGGQVEAVLSVQDPGGSSFTPIRRAADSRLVDITMLAQYPALYFLQLRQSGQGKVANYTVRVEPTQHPSLPPQITSMLSNANAGDILTVWGSGFGAQAGTLQFGRNANASVIIWSPLQIIAQVPQGSGTVDVVVKTSGGKQSQPFRFAYGPKLGGDSIQVVRDWANKQIPDSEKRLQEAEDRMWDAYVEAQSAYDELKATKGIEVFQEIDKAIAEANTEATSEVTGHLLSVLQEQAQKRGEKGATVVLPFVARYSLAALNYFEIGKWAAMDSVLIARNIRSQWYTWAILRPAVKEYQNALDELNTLKSVGSPPSSLPPPIYTTWQITANASIKYPRPIGRVSDFAGLLSLESKSKLESALNMLDQQTTLEIAVVIVPTLGELSIDEYAFRLFNTWRIGKRSTNNGILLVCAQDERRVRIEVGLGLGRFLSDDEAGQILDRDVVPNLHADKVDAAMTRGARAIAQTLLNNGWLPSMPLTSPQEWGIP
jgi:hypothetical protein